MLSLGFCWSARSPQKIPPACQENVKPQQRRQSVSQPAVLHSVSLCDAVEPPYTSHSLTGLLVLLVPVVVVVVVEAYSANIL